MYSLGAKLFVFVCRSTPSAMTPTCISWSPTGSILNLSIFAKGNLLLYCISPSTWGNQRGELPLYIKRISGAVAGESCLHDRGVSHYLLSFLFSLVSLPLSFYFCVPYQKYQKYLLLLWVPMKTPSCVTSLVTTIVTLSTLLLLYLLLQHLLMRLNLLC